MFVLIPILGMLNVVADGHSLEIFKNKAIEKCTTEKNSKEQELTEQLTKFTTYWNIVLTSAKLKKENLICLIKFALFLECNEELLNTSETRGELQSALKALEKSNVEVDGEQCTLREAVTKAAKCLREFSYNATSTNPELLIAITQPQA
jgi:hypothetical protein